ncbi:MAG: ATP-binding protein [Bacteroidales bacterium]|nr:ATP-binding protein [Bacteroidales bacterium]
MSTQRKINLVILFLFCLSLLAVFAFLLLTRKQERMFSEYSRRQVVEATGAITEMEEIGIYWVAHDYSLWDELIENLQNPDSLWLGHNLGDVLYWFDLDGLWVFNLEGELVYQQVNEHTNTITASYFRDFFPIKEHEEKLNDHYALILDNLLLFQLATIHPTEDYERESDAHGYLFLAKCWDEELLGLLGRLTGSSVELQTHDCIDEADVTENCLAVPYMGPDEEVLAWLVFKKHVDFSSLMRQNSRILIVLLITTMFASLLVFTAVLNKWVSRPLKLVADSISGDTKKYVPALQKTSRDFKRIGVLIEAFINQKKELLHQKERAEESDRLKSAFLANMSHEIRTPLNGILGFLELLDKPGLDDNERAKYIGIMHSSGQRLLDTINDILEVSLIEAGQAVVRNESVNTEDVMHYLTDFFEAQAHQKGLSFELAEHLKGNASVVITDRHKLISVFINLLKNAIKFTQAGSVVFGNYLKKGMVVFYIRDTGPGIPKGSEKAVFDRFVQADQSLSRQHEGSGLGLAIVQAYVTMLGGTVWLESRPGQGCTFYFSIPQKI